MIKPKILKLLNKESGGTARKLLLLSAAVLLFCSLTVYGLGSSDQTVTSETVSSGDVVLTSAGGLALTYLDDNRSISLRDTDGYIWNSSVTKESFDFESLNDSWKKNVTSFATIQYTTADTVNPNVKTGFSSDSTTKITASKKDGKLILTLSYAVGISFELILSFDGESLVCRLPKTSVKESSKFQLVSVELMPYFGASGEQTDGYMVYPDGSGALKHHKSEAAESVRGMAYTWGVYSDDLRELDTLAKNRNADIMTAFLPVFGIKNGKNGLVAFSTVGEAESLIAMHPAGDSIALNRMSFSFQYRSWYNISLSNIKIKGTDTAENPNGKKYNETMINTDHEVRYLFLKGDSADYSGMAAAYRQYLLKSGSLKKSGLADKLGVSVDLFMGAEEEGLFNSTMVTATTVSQAEKVIEAVLNAGCNSSVFTLTGWSDKGYGSYPQAIAADSSVGSKSQLTALLDKFKTVCLKTDLQTVGKDRGGYSVSSDVIKTGNQMALTGEDKDRFLFNISSVEKRFQKLEQYIGGSNGGYSLENLGRLLYSDYNKNAIVNKEEMKTKIKDMLSAVPENKLIAVDGANLYTLSSADLVYNLPDTSSEYFISDQSIPFVQMVLCGSIPYTSTAGNLSADFEEQLLKWLEYGYTPYFELTYENSDVLKNTGYNGLFTSVYTMHMDKLKEAYSMFETVKNAVGSSHMTKHQLINSTLVSVTYDNGVNILINYADKDQEYQSVTVKAKSYEIRK